MRCAARLKSNPATGKIPVIFLTSKGDVQDETHGLELGAVDYITKPFSVPIVQARLATHLALAEARRELERQNEILEQKVLQRSAKSHWSRMSPSTDLPVWQKHGIMKQAHTFCGLSDMLSFWQKH